MSNKNGNDEFLKEMNEPTELRTVGSFNEKTQTIKVMEKEQTPQEQLEQKASLDFENVEGPAFEDMDLGQFEFASLKNEGDTIDIVILEDLEELEKRGILPSWVPKNIETKCYVGTRYPTKTRILISKYYRLEQAVNQKGFNTGVFRVTRGKKSGTENNAFVEFDVKFAPTGK